MGDSFCDSLMGLTEEEAVAKIEAAGYLPAVGSNGPSPQPPVTPTTSVGVPNMKKVNIVLTNNVVTRAYFG